MAICAFSAPILAPVRASTTSHHLLPSDQAFTSMHMTAHDCTQLSQEAGQGRFNSQMLAHGRRKKIDTQKVTCTHSLVKKQAREVQQPDASTWEAVTTEFG
jgi:hypothetical protein